MKLYFNNLVSISEVEKLKLSSVISRIPDFIDESNIEDSADLSTTVRFLCQDFSGNLLLPSYQTSRPGVDYYSSKLHLYSFVICDVSTNTNYVYVYDQRLAGKDCNAMCSLRLLHHLSEGEKTRISLRTEPNQLLQCMDNNVGQNKSQIVFMFFALLSMTLYTEGVTLSFLTSGHSHFIPDRVTGNIKQSLKNRNIFCPEELLDTINTVKNVEAKFLDHRDAKVHIFMGWEKLLNAHFTEIPQLPKIGGYTSCYFFHFKNGKLSIRKSLQEEVCYVHQYVTGPTGECTQSDIERCVASLQSHLFLNKKTFLNATVEDVRFEKNGAKSNKDAPYLSEHPGVLIPLKQRISFWNKAHSIPLEKQAYYGPRPDGFTADENSIVIIPSLQKDSKKRSILQPATVKAIKKNEKDRSSLISEKSSLYNFFLKAPTVSSVVSKKPLHAKFKSWHEVNADDSKKINSVEPNELNLIKHFQANEEFKDPCEVSIIFCKHIFDNMN